MTIALLDYARYSTAKRDLAAPKVATAKLWITSDWIYTDHGLTKTDRSRPGLDRALAAVRTGDTFDVPKLDRLARSMPDVRTIADSLVTRAVRLALGTSVYDPADPMGKVLGISPMPCRVLSAALGSG